MSLLALDGVRKGYGADAAAVLRGVSLQLDAGELAVVWGRRGSGRSTLMRVAAGVQAPDGGSVRFEGHDLFGKGQRLVGAGIGYCHKTLRHGDGHTALDHAMIGLLSRWVAPAAARRRARAALERAGAAHCAEMLPRRLTAAEAVRVAVARTLALEPRLLVIDEPVKGVDLTERDGVLALLRSLADEGIAVLVCTGEASGLSEADRAFALSDGKLRAAPAAAPRLAPVVPLRQVSSVGA